MQAITTRYFGATNSHGSRIRASAAAGSKTIPWDDSVNSEYNHARAAKALAERFCWDGKWVGGGNRDGSWVWVCADNSFSASFEVK